MATRWSSGFADNQWWQVDLGSAVSIDKVELNWEDAYASRYKILTLHRRHQLHRSRRRHDQRQGTEDDHLHRPQRPLRARTGRHQVLPVRHLLLGRTGLRRRRDPAAPAAPAPAASASRRGPRPRQAGQRLEHREGDPRSRDGRGQQLHDALELGRHRQPVGQVDLGSAVSIDKVELNWEDAYASRYKILTSTDGTNFTEAADVTINAKWT